MLSARSDSDKAKLMVVCIKKMHTISQVACMVLALEIHSLLFYVHTNDWGLLYNYYIYYYNHLAIHACITPSTAISV